MIPEFIVRWFTPAPDSGVADDIRRGKSPWADSIHLLWSSWIFVTPLFDHGLNGYSRTWLLFTLATYPVFLLLFAKIQLAPRRTRHWYAWGMGLLCFATLRWYPSGLSYLVYACVMLGHCDLREFRNYVLQVLLLNAIYVALASWIGYPVQLLVIMPVTIVVICTIIGVERIYKEKDAALRLSHDEVRRLAATAERERIGRDLHDLLGHTLSLITLKLELSRKLLDRDQGAARHELAEAEDIARTALAEVRSAVTGIRTTSLAAELASAHLLLESSGVNMSHEPLGVELPDSIESVLALVVREAATNIARHAQAHNASITLARKGTFVHMRVADDGRGGVSTTGNGLAGMRERVQALGGQLRIESPRGQGTTLCIGLPVREPALRVPDAVEDSSGQSAFRNPGYLAGGRA